MTTGPFRLLTSRWDVNTKFAPPGGLGAIIGPDGLLFHPVSDSSRVIPERTFQINLKRAGERAGIGHVSPHDLRHTAVSLARDNGAPDTAVRDLVGHTTTSMTSRYTHTTPETLARVVDAVDRERTRPAAVASLDQRRRQA